MPTLEITTMVGCPLQCTFCPQDKLSAAYDDPVRVLTFENFSRVLAKVPKHVRIDFSGMAEPWMNRAATHMLALTLSEGYNVAIYTTLQGMRDPEYVVDLILAHAAQVEVVVVHLPDTRGNMRGFRDSDAYREALRRFDELANSTVRYDKVQMDEDSAVATPGWLPWHGLTRAGNLNQQNIAGQMVERDLHHDTPVTCSMTPFFDHNVLLPNGDVVLCCMDYSKHHVLGNLLLDDYYDLFISSQFNILRWETMQYHAGKGSLCRTCSRAVSLDVDEKKQYWRAK